VETRTYDATGRVVEVMHSLGATLLTRFDYMYDAVLNPITAVGLTGTETYTYDEADRIATVCYTSACTEPNSFIAYTYDGIGNRLTETRSTGVTTYAYDAGDQLIAETAPGTLSTTYEYDEAEN